MSKTDMNKSDITSNILSILDTWESYFETMDEGIGTTYERFILHRYFENLKNDYDVSSILEVPSFGMTGVSGINSLWWAQNGLKPVVIDTDNSRIEKSGAVWNSLNYPVDFQYLDDVQKLPFEDNTFDLSWNFASLWFVADLNKFFKELQRVTRKVLFICVPNHNGLGYIARNLVQKDKIEGFYQENIKPGNIKQVLAPLGMKIKKSGYLDIPPWPDIAMKKEDMLKKVGLGFLLKESVNSESTVFEKKCIVDYFSEKNPGLEEEILKYDFLERAPFPINTLWGHHRYFIIEVNG